MACQPSENTVTEAELSAIIDPAAADAGNIGNILALLKDRLNLYWLGIYEVRGESLGLSHFQGLPACTSIKMGKGVCGTAAEKGETVIVEDVSLFPGYIACHEEVRAEVVVPAFVEGKVVFVLDADSDRVGYFNPETVGILESAAQMIAERYYR